MSNQKCCNNVVYGGSMYFFVIANTGYGDISLVVQGNNPLDCFSNAVEQIENYGFNAVITTFQKVG